MIFGVALTAVPLACQNAAQPSKGKAMSVTYEAKVRKTRWIAGAKVVIDLRIQNNGSAPFETPDPRYPTSAQPLFELTGPQGGKQAFRPSSRATEWHRDKPPATVRLDPGQAWNGDMLLSEYANLESPGRYTLRTWIESSGSRIESAPANFEIVSSGTRSLAAELSFGEENSIVVECVELLDNGQVATSILTERDPRNAELLPFRRLERGTADTNATTIFAPYSNFSVGLSALRWIIVERDRKLIVGHNRHASRIAAFQNADLARILPPVATNTGLYVSGIRGTELVLSRVVGSKTGMQEGPVWTIEKLATPPAAVTMTVSPAAAGSTLLFLLAWNANDGIRVQLLMASADGKIIGRAEHNLPGLRAAAHSAIAWSTAGEIRASLLTRSLAKESELRATELRLKPDLSAAAPPHSSEPVTAPQAAPDARVAYFESVPGRLSRMIVIRSGEQTWVIPSDGAPRAPLAAIPASGPFTILPGQMYWYGVWSADGTLKIEAL